MRNARKWNRQLVNFGLEIGEPPVIEGRGSGMNDHDIIVIGAGPGGSAAAYCKISDQKLNELRSGWVSK
jgi:hypothetical protein